MSQAPPTPPPTSATELADQARQNASLAADVAAETETTPAAAPVPVVDPYQSIVPTLLDLTSRLDYRGLIRIVEQADLQTEDDTLPSRLLITAPLVLSYLIFDELPPARYALYRLPESFVQNPLRQLLLALVASVWDRKHANVYARSADLVKMFEQSDFSENQIGLVLNNLLTAFLEKFRARTFKTLTKAYTSLPIQLAEMYLGLPQEQIIAGALQYNWDYDIASQALSPTSASKTIISAGKLFPKASSLDTFEYVADGVARLEV